MQIQFYFVDVFADRPLTGNPLAIVPHAESLTDEMMRRVAGELNQAETTFILPSKNTAGDARLRSFTAPGHEVFGAGHNSLGAWWWLAASGGLKLRDGSNHFMQESGDRVLPVEVRCQGQELSAVVLTQSPPQFDKVCSELSELAAALRMETEDILQDSAGASGVDRGRTSSGACQESCSHRSCPSRCRATRTSSQVSRWGRLLFIQPGYGLAVVDRPCKILQPDHGNCGGLGNRNRCRPPSVPVGQARDCQGRFDTPDRARI